MSKRSNDLPRPTCRTRAWRINGVEHELIPIGVAAARARRGGRDVCELRRKADDRRLALLWWRDLGDDSVVEVRPVRGCGRGSADALRALARPWVAAAAKRGRLRIVFAGRRVAIGTGQRAAATLRCRGAAIAPVLDAIRVPADYVQRTGLPSQAEPDRLVQAGTDRFGRVTWMAEPAARAWIRMRDSALADGIALELVSGFRHVAYQTRLFQRKFVRGLSLDEVLAVNAAPGYSEHHTGRAIDITTPGSPPAEEAFEATFAFAWLQANAPGYGFRLSYPRGNPHGVIYEPWHWMYVPG